MESELVFASPWRGARWIALAGAASALVLAATLGLAAARHLWPLLVLFAPFVGGALGWTFAPKIEWRVDGATRRVTRRFRAKTTLDVAFDDVLSVRVRRIETRGYHAESYGQTTRLIAVVEITTADDDVALTGTVREHRALAHAARIAEILGGLKETLPPAYPRIVWIASRGAARPDGPDVRTSPSP